jgi:hypothetical protein
MNITNVFMRNKPTLIERQPKTTQNLMYFSPQRIESVTEYSGLVLSLSKYVSEASNKERSQPNILHKLELAPRKSRWPQHLNGIAYHSIPYEL